MTPDEFVQRYSQVFHVTAPGSWPNIEALGLLSTSALLDLYGVPKDERVPLEERRRPDPYPLFDPRYGQAVLRDQHPLSESKLEGCLTGMTVPQWLRLLNGRVFFWVGRDRLKKLLKAYGGEEHEVITFDSARLLKSHGTRVELSPINSGSTLHRPVPRGSRTFRPLSIYETVEKGAPVELTVLYSVPDARDLAERVELFAGPERLQELWVRD